MNVKEPQDALKVAIESGLPLSAPVYVQAADGTCDEIRDIASDQSSVTILLRD